jgi:SAM-dependent methyltransferase
MTVTREDVHNAYRYILGRFPESAEVVENQTHYDSFTDLRVAFLSSAEFRDQGFHAGQKAFRAFSARENVETDTDEATLQRIVEKTAQTWSTIGRSMPHYSVVSDERFTPEQFASNEAAFWQSGADDCDRLLALLRRIGRSASEFGCCVDYGCGVGRMTGPLAAVFPRVIALDVSPPHLELARNRAKSLGFVNVDFDQVTPDNLMPASGYNLWFSRYVLQHNPPPATLAILDKAFAGLAEDGIAVIHVPTFAEGYSFSIAEYLAGQLGRDLEMHFAPQLSILELGFSHRCRLKEIHEEPWHHTQIANIFVFQKMMD